MYSYCICCFDVCFKVVVKWCGSVCFCIRHAKALTSQADGLGCLRPVITHSFCNVCFWHVGASLPLQTAVQLIESVEAVGESMMTEWLLMTQFTVVSSYFSPFLAMLASGLYGFQCLTCISLFNGLP